MADNISLKYTVLNENPFAEAEPYLYGSGSPNAWYFLPIGEDNDNTTTADFKVQLAESNGYSTVKYLDAFKINGNSIAYLEQGTFPVMRLIKSYASPYVASDHNTNTNSDTPIDANNGESDTHKAFCKLIITYDITYDINTSKNIKNIKTIQLNYYHLNKTTDPASSLLSDLDSATASDSFTIYSRGDGADKDIIKFIKHNTERCPKRLGFILTGGGGGAGGISQLDPNKNKSGGDQYTTSGGGGGGVHRQGDPLLLHRGDGAGIVGAASVAEGEGFACGHTQSAADVAGIRPLNDGFAAHLGGIVNKKSGHRITSCESRAI